MIIGFVGAILMGGPMIRNLAAAGHEVRLYARRPGRAVTPAGEESLVRAKSHPRQCAHQATPHDHPLVGGDHSARGRRPPPGQALTTLSG